MASTRQKDNQQDQSEELSKLRAELEDLRKDYSKVQIEKNFLARAMEDLNFHNNAHDGVIYTDADTNVLYANPCFLQMMGLDEDEELLNQPLPEYMWADKQDADKLFNDIARDGFVREREVRLNNRHGEPVFALCSGVASRDEQGNLLGAEIMLCNVTSKRTVEAQLAEQYALLDAVLRSTPDPVLVLDGNSNVQRLSPTAQQLFNLADAQNLPALTALLKQWGANKEMLQALNEKFETDMNFETELALGDKVLELRAAPMDFKERGWVCIVHDITERKKTEEQLQYYAFHDMLTGLPNRTHFIERLERIISRAAHDEDYRFALLFIDVDELKRVNDGYGHLAGDQLLSAYARRLENCIRPDDLVCRLGGDEFAVFLNGVESEEAAGIVAARIQQSLQKPIVLMEKHKVKVTASIGIACSRAGETDIDTLLNEADKGMYSAKEAGR